MIEVIHNKNYMIKELKKALSLKRYNKPIEKLTYKEKYTLDLVFKEIYRIK